MQFTFPSDKEDVKVESFEPAFLKVDAPERLARGRWRVTAHVPKDAPGAAVSDPHYTIRAWRGVVTYLLRRPEFLYE